jgi:hypothetical protein
MKIMNKKDSVTQIQQETKKVSRKREKNAVKSGRGKRSRVMGRQMSNSDLQ